MIIPVLGIAIWCAILVVAISLLPPPVISASAPPSASQPTICAPRSASLHQRHGWRIPGLRLQLLSPGLRLGTLTQQLLSPTMAPISLISTVGLLAGLPHPSDPPWSVVDHLPPRDSIPPALSGCLSTWFIGSPSLPQAPPPPASPGFVSPSSTISFLLGSFVGRYCFWDLGPT